MLVHRSQRHLNHLTHPRYCVWSPIVVHGRQTICPRYCVGFIHAPAGAQVWPQASMSGCRFEFVLVWVRGLSSLSASCTLQNIRGARMPLTYSRYNWVNYKLFWSCECDYLPSTFVLGPTSHKYRSWVHRILSILKPMRDGNSLAVCIAADPGSTGMGSANNEYVAYMKKHLTNVEI